MSRVGNLSSRIFVGGMDPSVDELDLEKAFKLFGEITNVMVMRDKENGRSRGFAFISFKNPQSSDDAISRMHGVEIRGRCVSVRHAEKEKFVRDDRPKRGGFRGGRIATGSRSDNFRSAPSYRGNGYQGAPNYGMSQPPPSNIVYVVRDDNEAGLSRRSRSPLGGPRYRQESPVRYGGERRAYSPPPYQSRPISPRGMGSGMAEESNYYSDMRGMARSPPRSDFSRFQDQELSPARELGAYIRARDQSPSFAPQVRKRSPEPISRRRSPSPVVNRSYADRNLTQRNYQSTVSKYDNQSPTRFDSRNDQTSRADRNRGSVQQRSSSVERYRDSGRQPTSVVRHGGAYEPPSSSFGRSRGQDSQDYRSQPAMKRDDRERFSPPRGRTNTYRGGGSSMGGRQGDSYQRGGRETGQSSRDLFSRGGRETGQSSRDFRERVSPRRDVGSRDSQSYRPRGSASARGGFRGRSSPPPRDNYRDRSPRRDSRNRGLDDRDRQQPSRYRDSYQEKRVSPVHRRPVSGDRGPPARSPRGRSPPRRRSPPPRRY